MSSPPCSGETMKAERMTRDWFGEAQFAVIFFVLLLGINIFLNPARFRLDALSGATSVIPVLAVLAGWWLIKPTPYYEHLMANGGDDRAAYTSSIPITTVRMIAYMLTGIGAGLASLSLSALLGSADPTVGPTYTLTAIAAVALGGVSLAGGRGGLTGAMLGAADIFLLQSILTFFNVSTFALQVAYGVILIVALALNSTQGRSLIRLSRGKPI